jgi:hypothetical protein
VDSNSSEPGCTCDKKDSHRTDGGSEKALPVVLYLVADGSHLYKEEVKTAAYDRYQT